MYTFLNICIYIKYNLKIAQFRCNLNSELCIRQPLFFYIGGPNTDFLEHRKIIFHRLCIQACLLVELIFFSSRPLRTMGQFLEISIAGRKYLCVSGNVVLWSKHFDIIILVPMLYSELHNHMYMYMYMHMYIHILCIYIYVYIYIYI